MIEQDLGYQKLLERLNEPHSEHFLGPPLFYKQMLPLHIMFYIHKDSRKRSSSVYQINASNLGKKPVLSHRLVTLGVNKIILPLNLSCTFYLNVNDNKFLLQIIMLP